MLFFKKKKNEIKAFVSGRLIPIEEVGDGVFSKKVLGDGIAIEPTSDELLAPTDGVVTVVIEDSYHAVAIQTEDKTQILLHIGIDTVSMNGDGFHCYVKVGDRVKCGQKLITFNRSKIQEAGYRDVTIMVIAEVGKAGAIKFVDSCDVIAGKTVISEA